jgi:hypothetical protein
MPCNARHEALTTIIRPAFLLHPTIGLIQPKRKQGVGKRSASCNGSVFWSHPIAVMMPIACRNELKFARSTTPDAGPTLFWLPAREAKCVRLTGLYLDARFTNVCAATSHFCEIITGYSSVIAPQTRLQPQSRTARSLVYAMAWGMSCIIREAELSEMRSRRLLSAYDAVVK